MITGEISARREAILTVEIMSARSVPHRVEAVLDTGFTEFLTLPKSSVMALALRYDSDTEMTLADGSVEHVEVYIGRVVWDGHERAIQVHASEGDVLVGMALLYGYHVGLDVVDGGRLTITPLPCHTVPKGVSPCSLTDVGRFPAFSSSSPRLPLPPIPRRSRSLSLNKWIPRCGTSGRASLL
jgi:clan AA aspartic protease